MELLLGCGHLRTKRLWLDEDDRWKRLVTLDMTPEVHPEIVSLADRLPFKDSSFNEIHAYEILEHMGQQGDWRTFFRQFDEYARVLKDQGLMFITTPAQDSKWLWGDPGHTRYIGPESMFFLSRTNYAANIKKKTCMTDYRPYFKSDWDFIHTDRMNDSNVLVIRNRKEEHGSSSINRG